METGMAREIKAEDLQQQQRLNRNDPDPDCDGQPQITRRAADSVAAI
jgi:hypothetical protein